MRHETYDMTWKHRTRARRAADWHVDIKVAHPVAYAHADATCHVCASWHRMASHPIPSHSIHSHSIPFHSIPFHSSAVCAWCMLGVMLVCIVCTV